VLSALPSARAGTHDTVPGEWSRTARPADRDRAPKRSQVAREPTLVDPELAGDIADDGETAGFAYAHRIVIVAERAVLAALAALVGCAILAAGSDSLPVHPLALAMWATGGSLSAVGLAAMTTDPDSHIEAAGRRRFVGAMLLLVLLACVTGIVAAANGVAGPAWVLFLPLVVIVGAVLGAVPGLLTGLLAAAGVYVAAVLSHTASVAGAGRLVVLLPAFPVAGLAAGSLCAAMHEAAGQARGQRSALQGDVGALTSLLNSVAEGDLSGERLT